MADVKDFLNPKSMITPGVASTVVVLVTNSLAFQFDLPARYIAIGLSSLLGILTVVNTEVKRVEKFLYGLLNSLVIFSAAMGANGIAERATAPSASVWPDPIQRRGLVFEFVTPVFAAQTTPREGDLLRAGSTVYAIVDGEAKRIPDDRTLWALGFDASRIRDASSESIRGLRHGSDYPTLTNSLVRGVGPTVYVLRAGRRVPIPDAETFESMGYQWKDVTVMPDAQLNAIPTGNALSKAKRFFRTW